ncbi:SigB/SigF/SigG family RNA polymerase sigma factor [Gordonia sp. PDNC005]|uniref:SigB/SigF/SigG family RNA polymerase sigma factor n=1 Tax=unclassified Gordonia (in: high G+C Gram-positive bacteria) TaxID=2657482 RepID=UPI0019633AF0|nr:SigB/SigF/SigG family RNA polymerase sigma factor [Gordonia sp. PDNC005]QRY61301.1 SigB/SigF/SigG family RNA polymerase sigma factor [Gordonia sp. PDNC005]
MKDHEYDHVSDLLAERENLHENDPRRVTLRDRAVVESLPLAQHIAQRFGGRGESHDDLVQVARLGLVQAVDRFQPSRGADFLSFAVPTVMGEVRRHFRDKTAMLRTPRRIKELALRMSDAESRLTHRLLRSPTKAELAADLEVDVADIDEARLAAAASSTVSLDRPVSGDQDDRPTVERLGHVDHRYAVVDDTHSLRPALARLRDRERRIIGLRYFEDLSQSAIAERTGLSQMHVSRLLRQSIADLRQELTPA